MTASQVDPVVTLVQDAVQRFLGDGTPLRELGARVSTSCGNLETIDRILSDRRRLSYRDGLLVQVAYALATPGLDTTLRPDGARTVCQRLGAFLGIHHIPAVKDAYQNIAKNSRELVRGNFAEFDEFLRWARSATREQLEACFEYACCVVALTARPVTPMPAIDLTRLKFAAVMRLLDALMAEPSGGMHEQFAVAALLHALVQQRRTGEYVETKSVNASDASSGTAGDVQIMVGSRVQEAYEVTAASWETKLSGSSDKLKQYDLSRMHIIAPVGQSEWADLLSTLLGRAEDLSVLDLRGFASVAVSELLRQYRKVALERIYELLDQHGSHTDRANRYVRLLLEHGLCA